MLRGLREHAGNFAAKVLLALLVLSFAVWGIGDMAGGSGRNAAVATVGSESISVQDYQMALKRETENLRRALGNNYSPELLNSSGLPQYVLRSLVSEALFKLESQALGLIPGDADIVRHIRSNPSFQDEKGEFDKNIFSTMLQQTGSTEKIYVDQLRENMAANLIVDTLSGVKTVPDGTARAVLAAREEQRSATFYVIGPAQLKALPAPTAEQIDAYYKEHSAEFSAPEYRTVSYTSFKHDDVRARAKVSEDDLRRVYKERVDEFRTPERRVVEQLLYNSEDKAKKAHDMLKAGTEFGKVARTTEILNKTAVSLGPVERGGIIEQAEENVFGMKEGEFTAPVQSPFGWHIFRIVRIQEPSTASFNEVRPTLEKDLRQQAVDDALNTLSNTLEDALAGGSTLQEAAKELGLSVTKVGTIDRQGKAPDGSSVKLPDFDKFIDTVFKTDEKTESSLITTKGGVYYTVRVEEIIPERLRALSEVKSRVIAGWQAEQRARQLAKLADEIGRKFSDKGTRSEAIDQYNLDVVSAGPIKRSSHTADGLTLPETLVTDLFSRPAGENTAVYPLKDGRYALAVVNDVIPARLQEDGSDKKVADISRELQGTVNNEIMEQYINHLSRKYAVSIHQNVLKSVLGTADN